MLKIARYIALIFFAFLWFLGCSPDTARWLGKQGLVQDDYRYGDLYRFANLREFRVPVDKCEPPAVLQNKIPVNLYLFGDSFTEEGRIEADHFVAQSFTRRFVAEDGYVSVNANEKNVLIIETVERHFRERFDSTYSHVMVNKTKPEIQSTLWDKILAWELPYNTERHESILFGSDFFFSIKEWKAAINRHVFSRTDDNVRLSKDDKHLVYGLAAKPGPNSSFDVIPNDEITQLVENINSTYAKYKNEGFDEVYLNIIPNKTSILATGLGEYNHLIERIQQHPKLKMPFIDTYSKLQSGGEKLFDKGDTHWNCAGKQLWINDVNERLIRVAGSTQ